MDFLHEQVRRSFMFLAKKIVRGLPPIRNNRFSYSSVLPCDRMFSHEGGLYCVL